MKKEEITKQCIDTEKPKLNWEQDDFILKLKLKLIFIKA